MAYHVYHRTPKIKNQRRTTSTKRSPLKDTVLTIGTPCLRLERDPEAVCCLLCHSKRCILHHFIHFYLLMIITLTHKCASYEYEHHPNNSQRPNPNAEHSLNSRQLHGQFSPNGVRSCLSKPQLRSRRKSVCNQSHDSSSPL